MKTTHAWPRHVPLETTPNASRVSALVGLILFWGWILLPAAAGHASTADTTLTAFANGPGPTVRTQSYHLLEPDLDAAQANAIAFAQDQTGRFERRTLSCLIKVTDMVEGGSFMFLSSAAYGRRGPGPFLKDWAEPNLAGSFALGLDLHNPPGDQSAGAGGNYQDRPQRELSLHWDGREIANRFVPVGIRDSWAELNIALRHVIGGAEITVELAGVAVFTDYFIPGLHPYPGRLAIGAGSPGKDSGSLTVRDLHVTATEPTTPGRPPLQVELFNHVRTTHNITAHRTQVQLPPLDWALGRIVLTLELHDAGKFWDSWDRNGFFYLIDAAGQRHDILPFITSFRTPGRWQADVSHFRPWLTGDVTFEIATTSGGQADLGFLLSASLDFYHGEPELIASQVIPFWQGTARYQSAANHYRDFFHPRTVTVDGTAQAARLYLYSSGHGPVGEFTPHRRTVTFLPDRNTTGGEAHSFSERLWSPDNYLNPIRPQRGTWHYARAGWAPGDLVRPWVIDLSPWLIPGAEAELRYRPHRYDVSARPDQVVSSDAEINNAALLVRTYLVLYKNPGTLRPAPAIKVLKVFPDSNGERHGVQEGDLLLNYDGQFPKSIEQLQELIKVAEGTGRGPIALEIYRAGESMTLQLEAGLIGIQIGEEVLNQ